MSQHVAITGGTGFVGKAVLALAAEQGIAIRALTRRPQEPCDGISWVSGDLADADALDRLVDGAQAVIHIAGVVNARDRAGFLAGNGEGTHNLVAAMKRQGAERLVHVSSLAAREPQLSDYGWSKAEAERHVCESPLDWTVVRPPAIYGPGDAELLELFQMAARGFVLLPPGGRLSVIHVDDLARLLLVLAARKGGETRTATYEVDDGQSGGRTHVAFAQAIGRAVGRDRVRTLALPASALKFAARIDRLLRGDKARLTPDRAAYFSHSDWVARTAMHVPRSIWTPAVTIEEGLLSTAQSYRLRGHLR
ncbi:SDR family oxidoreductase [Sphingobium sp. CR28]|uniref:SDR family oxidoreductase n=1 Tax=Sphingobium sp. CR28 TaxID=3400272 RepID=UPI003FEF7D88